MSILATLVIVFIEIIPYFVVIICGVKMVKYVEVVTEFDEDMKTLVKQLTKTLIILVCFKLVLVCFKLILILF